MMTLDPAILSSAEAARAQLLERQHELERARADLNHEIRRLHAAGGSMREISEKLGLSHQRVHQIVAGGDSGSDSLLRRLADRVGRTVGGATTHFTADARATVARSHTEAADLGAPGVEPEHLLLALAAPAAGASASALNAAGVTREAVLTAIRHGVNTSPPRKRQRAQMSFSPATKKALELSLREALRRGDGHIGSEHILRGLLRGADERTIEILATTGVTPQDVLEALPPQS